MEQDKKWNLSSNSHLNEELEKMQEKYEECQQKIKNIYDVMLDLSQQYVQIKSILNKRQGKNNGNTN